MFPLKNKLCTEGCGLKVYNESKRKILLMVPRLEMDVDPLWEWLFEIAEGWLLLRLVEC